MRTTPTATAIPKATERAPRARGIPLLLHALALAWVGGMLLAARLEPVRYEAWLQEDRLIEWSTVALFAAAGILRLRAALPRRALFDVLVALFCLFVAGEEFSWGQRLLGFTPPETFLAHNTQQELTLHNFADVFGRPKGVLMLALGGYALLAVLAVWRPAARVMQRIGATPPAPSAAGWLLAAVALLAWYPADYTGEWVEALAGGIFLATSPVRRPLPVLLFAGAATLALTYVSGHARATDPPRAACALREVQAIVLDLEAGAATSQLVDRGRVHKRLFTAMREGYIDAAALSTLHATPCAAASESRRAHGIDPWGNAYWLETSRPAPGVRALTIYSFGPNRRRDEADGRPAGDDIAAYGEIAW